MNTEQVPVSTEEDTAGGIGGVGDDVQEDSPEETDQDAAQMHDEEGQEGEEGGEEEKANEEGEENEEAPPPLPPKNPNPFTEPEDEAAPPPLPPKNRQKHKVHSLFMNTKTSMIYCFSCKKEINEDEVDDIDDEETEARKELISKFRELVLPMAPPEAATSSSKHIQGVCGLSNLGNTCYINSVLQSLSNITALTHYLNTCTALVPTNKLISRSYAELLQAMWSGQHASLQPWNMIRQIRENNATFQNNSQHDAQEFLHWMLERMHSELKEYENPPTRLEAVGSEENADDEGPYEPKAADQLATTSIISDLFQGTLLSSLTCLECKTVSETHDSFYNLSVTIPDKKTIEKLQEQLQLQEEIVGANGLKLTDPKSVLLWVSSLLGITSESVPLDSCLRAFCMTEALSGTDAHNCDVCQRRTSCQKTFTVSKPPEVLCIHVKRFKYDYFGSKVGTHVQFPMKELNLQSLSTEGGDKSVTYDLVAVIAHRGLLLVGGHYVSYAKNPETDEWYEFDDSKTKRVSEKTVKNSQAYVLFYRRIPASSRVKSRTRLNRLLTKHKASKDDQKYYVRADWWSRMQTAAVNVPPVTNHRLLCKHSLIHPLCTPVNKKVKMLSEPVWEAIVSEFGGGPAITDLQSCSECEEELAALREYKKQQQDDVSSKDRKKLQAGEQWHLISSQWLLRWKNYVASEEAPHPGPITNFPDLLEQIPEEERAKIEATKAAKKADEKQEEPSEEEKNEEDADEQQEEKEDAATEEVKLDHDEANEDETNAEDADPWADQYRIKKHLRKVVHYRGLVPSVWKVLQDAYGGGPAITRPVISIYKKAAL